MRLIRRIRIENFRSIQDVTLDALDDVTAFTGVNGAGKSNILRALSLFFNSEIEPGAAFELQRDYHKPKSKKAKIVRVGLEFNFPLDFHIHTSLRGLVAAGGINVPTPQPLGIQKSWRFDAIARDVLPEFRIGPDLGNLHTATADEARAADALLALIKFRYVPNHAHPSVILTSELENLRRELLSRLKKRKTYQQYQQQYGQPLFQELASVAADLVAPITRRIAQGSDVVQSVNLDVPLEFSDLVWESALNVVTPTGDTFGTLLQGSGTQAHLMYLVLDLVDNSYGNTFGWRQAVIWAFEEPESFLHSGLQARVSDFLRTRVESPRLQVLLSTHNPVLMAAGSHGYLVEINAGATRVTRLSSRDLIQHGFSGSVSPFVHPLVVGVPQPLLLLEGDLDVKYVRAAYASMDREPPWEIHCLNTLDASFTSGGVDSMKRYLQNNIMAINARPTGAPVYVLLDWEEGNSVAAFNQVLAGHPTSRALAFPEVLSNTDLGPTFRGIERFLSTDFWRAAITRYDIARTRNQALPLRIFGQELDRVKPLLPRLLEERSDSDDVAPLVRALQWLDSGAGPIQVELEHQAAPVA